MREDYAEIVVVDNGIGFDQVQAERDIRCFFQAECEGPV